MNATIEGYLAACQEAESDIEDVQYRIARIRAELTRAESALIGARERASKAKETLRVVSAQEAIDLVTIRESEIAAMKGIRLVCGEPLPFERRREVFAAPPLPQFTPSID